MKLAIVVKQKEERVIKVDNVSSYYFDKAHLVMTLDNGKRKWFKTSTVLSIEEE